MMFAHVRSALENPVVNEVSSQPEPTSSFKRYKIAPLIAASDRREPRQSESSL